jgi:hypothetical protein
MTTLNEMQQVIFFFFQRLTPNEKCVYEEKARKGKEEARFNLENKFTSQGKSYAEVEREKNEAIEQLNKMNYEIETTVRSLDYCSCELNV